MTIDSVRSWLAVRPRCRQALVDLERPLTVTQAARILRLDRDSASYLLRSMYRQGLVRCLNSGARTHRVYGLTRLGRKLQAWLREIQHLPQRTVPDCDWSLFGLVCSRHRAAVLLALDAPLRVTEVRRHARRQDPDLRMSSNNTGDVLRFFLLKGLVERIERPKSPFPHYQLTDLGRYLRRLLLDAREAARAPVAAA